MGRPDWNFETVKFSKSQKEKYRYEPPPAIPGSKWIRTDRRVSTQKSHLSQSSTSSHNLNRTSQERLSWEQSEIHPVESKQSVTARAKEYWANHVQTYTRNKSSLQRPCTSLSAHETGSFTIGSVEDAGFERPETAEGYACRFRYNVRGVRGPSFGRGERRDDVDLKILDSRTKPGAGDYNVARQDSTPSTGGKMLENYEAVGSASWEVRKKKGIPAPGQYDRDLSEPLHTTGGRFANNERWKENELFEQRSQGLPGPTDYASGDARDKINKRVSGGLISDANVKSELDWTLLRGSRTPGLPLCFFFCTSEY